MSQEGSSVLLSQRGRDAEGAMPAVEDFFNAIAHRIRARLVNRSASDIEVRVAGVEVKSLGDVVEDPEYRENSIYGLLRFTPPGLPGLVVLQGTLMSRIIGAMLGEFQDDDEAEVSAIHTLTAVEQQIALRVCNDVVTELSSAWPVGNPPRIEVERPATSGRVVGGAIRTVAVFSATIDFGPPTNPFGLLSCNVPVQVFRDMGTTTVLEQDKPGKVDTDLSRVMPLEVELVAEMAQLTMSVNELHAMKIGDVLEVGPARTAVLKINGHPIMEGKPGEVEGHRSVQISRRLG